jgi:hypothetical protein
MTRRESIGRTPFIAAQVALDLILDLLFTTFGLIRQA